MPLGISWVSLTDANGIKLKEELRRHSSDTKFRSLELICWSARFDWSLQTFFSSTNSGLKLKFRSLPSASGTLLLGSLWWFNGLKVCILLSSSLDCSFEFSLIVWIGFRSSFYESGFFDSSRWLLDYILYEELRETFGTSWLPGCCCWALRPEVLSFSFIYFCCSIFLKKNFDFRLLECFLSDRSKARGSHSTNALIFMGDL